MIKNLFIIMLAIVLAVSFSSVAFAQDATKKEMKKDMKVEEKKELKSYSCDPQCGFMVRSHDDKEIVDVVKMHAKKQHNMDVTDKDVMAGMKAEKMEMKKEMMKEEKKEMK